MNRPPFKPMSEDCAIWKQQQLSNVSLILSNFQDSCLSKHFDLYSHLEFKDVFTMDVTIVKGDVSAYTRLPPSFHHTAKTNTNSDICFMYLNINSSGEPRTIIYDIHGNDITDTQMADI